MTKKLEWEYKPGTGDYEARYKGLIIRACVDIDPQNPMDDDGNWPMLVLSDRRVVEYDKVPGAAVRGPADRFSDALLVMCQKDLVQLFNYASVQDWLESWDVYDDEGDSPPTWIWDAQMLHNLLENELSSTPVARELDAFERLYDLLGVPHLRTTRHGYVQGETLDMLVVATPEAQKALRSRPADMDDEAWANALQDDMGAQADIYAAWAFGDTYGWQVCREIETDDGDTELEELDACWGYYGTDFHQNGLEADALASADWHAKETNNA